MRVPAVVWSLAIVGCELAAGQSSRRDRPPPKKPGGDAGDRTHLTIKEFGKRVPFVLLPEDAGFDVMQDGGTLRLRAGEHVYLAAELDRNAPERTSGLKRFSLPGSLFHVAVNLHGASCGCVASFYSVSEPKLGPDTFSIDRPVPELDLFRMHTHAAVQEAHACSHPWNAKNCDMQGTVAHRLGGPGDGDFGPGAQFAINTLEPFSVSVGFHSDRTVLTEYQQHDRVVRRFNNSFAGNVWDDLQSQILAFSYRRHEQYDADDKNQLGTCEDDPAPCPDFVTFSQVDVRRLWKSPSEVSLAATFCVATALLTLFGAFGAALVWRVKGRAASRARRLPEAARPLPREPRVLLGDGASSKAAQV